MYFDAKQLPSIDGTEYRARSDGNGYFWANHDWQKHYRDAVREASVFILIVTTQWWGGTRLNHIRS